MKAPQEQIKVVAIAPAAARRLAFYEAANGVGVLAPRGWNCFGIYGSNGSSLFVSPDPIDATRVLSSSWSGFSGAAVQISYSYSETSGRFSVARIIARVFPKYTKYVQDVVAEGIEPASSFPSGPYPGDKLIYRSNEVVHFETPAGSDGLGTQSRLKKGSASIHGVAILVGEPHDLVQLSMRLTPQTKDIATAIVQQVEYDAMRIKFWSVTP